MQTSTRLKESTQSDAAVIATNDDAFMCKYSAVMCGYYADEFIQAIVDAVDSPIPAAACRRPPLINRGTFVRTHVVQRLVETFLAEFAAQDTVQVVSLGAGYDTLPFRLFDSEPTCSLSYVELDLAPVTRSKAQLVQSVGRVSSLFETVESVEEGLGVIATVKSESERSSTYSLYPCDLRDLAALSTAFNACRIDFSAPTLFLTECVLMYLKPTHSDSLLRFVTTKFKGPRCFVNYEPIKPHDAFGRQMVSNIGRRGSVLLGIDEYPNELSQKKRFQQCGWPSVDAVDMLQTFNSLFSFEQKLALNCCERLDEIEEWNLIMAHYVVVFARSSVDVCSNSLLERVNS